MFCFRCSFTALGVALATSLVAQATGHGINSKTIEISGDNVHGRTFNDAGTRLTNNGIITIESEYLNAIIAERKAVGSTITK